MGGLISGWRGWLIDGCEGEMCKGVKTFCNIVYFRMSDGNGVMLTAGCRKFTGSRARPPYCWSERSYIKMDEMRATLV